MRQAARDAGNERAALPSIRCSLTFVGLWTSVALAHHWGVTATQFSIPSSLVAESVNRTISEIDKSLLHLRRMALLAPAADLGGLVRHPNLPTTGVLDHALTDRTG